MGEIVKEGLAHANVRRMIGILSVLLTLIAVEIVATVLIPQWREYFFDGIEQKQYDVFIQGMWYFAALMAAFVVSQGFKYYTVHLLALEWRTALNSMLLQKWRRAGLVAVDNPDQRISEDIIIASEKTLEVSVEVLISVAIIIGLVGSMSSLLLIVSLIYTAGIAVIAAFFHRPMVDREKLIQRAEADYRFKLAQCVMDGKRRSVGCEYNVVVKQFLSLIRIKMGFTLFSLSKANFMNLIPYSLLVPMYFAGDLGFGEVMKGISQFDLLVINATILIIVYPKITKAIASYERIKEFYNEIS